MKKKIVMSSYMEKGTTKTIYMKCHGYRELMFVKNKEDAKEAINKFVERMLDELNYPDITIEFSAVEGYGE